jgi:hypothetical protein
MIVAAFVQELQELSVRDFVSIYREGRYINGVRVELVVPSELATLAP